MKDPTLGAYDIADLCRLARSRLPQGVFEFFDRGNGDETALVENRAAFERIRLNPHALVDTSRRSQEVTLFGRRHRMPIAIAPTGSAGLAWHE
ncbi:MAG TPA: alpha-hydroxy-acid oxidizing protein, partial [Burkholderiales bacterium]|nr:alpha-hydroxy-acid oxidizing protein [Burkholderiales bacterium]